MWEEFLAEVRERGQYTTDREAERVARVVLALLGGNLADPEGKELADRLAAQGARLLLDPVPAPPSLGPRRVVEGVAALIEGATEETARWDTNVVLSALAELAGPSAGPCPWPVAVRLRIALRAGGTVLSRCPTLGSREHRWPQRSVRLRSTRPVIADGLAAVLIERRTDGVPAS